MIKVISNRTIGLQRKTIEDSFTESDCKVCVGKGFYTVEIPGGAIRNLKAKAGVHLMSIECTQCKSGKVVTKLRVIRRNNISAIL